MKNIKTILGLFVIVLMAITYLTPFIVHGEDQIPQNMELKLVYAPNKIAPHSVGLYIYNLTNHGSQRTVEVSALNVPDNVYVNILPDRINMTPEQTTYIYVYVRTGDIELNQTFNLTLKVEDIENRAVSTSMDFTVKIAEKIQNLLSLSIDKDGYVTILIRGNDDYDYDIDQATNHPLSKDMTIFVQNELQREEATTDDTNIGMIVIPAKEGMELNNEIDMVYNKDESSFESVQSTNFIVPYTISNIGENVISQVSLSTYVVNPNSAINTMASDNGYNYMTTDYVATSISQSSGAIKYEGQKEGSKISSNFGFGAFRGTNASSPLSIYSKNTLTAYAIKQSDRYNDYRDLYNSLNNITYTNVLPQKSTLSRALISGSFGSAGASSPLPYNPSEFHESNGFYVGVNSNIETIEGSHLSTLGSHIGSDGFYSHVPSNQLSTGTDGSITVDEDAQDGIIHNSEETQNTGQISGTITVKPTKLTTLALHSMSASEIVCGNTLTKKFFTIIQMKVHVSDKFERIVYLLVPFLMRINIVCNENPVPPPPTPTTQKARIVVKEMTLTTESQKTEFTLEDVNTQLQIPISFTFDASILNYDPSTTYTETSINIWFVGYITKIYNSLEGKYYYLKSNGEITDNPNDPNIGIPDENTILNSGTYSKDTNTYQPSYFNTWTVVVSPSHYQLEPDNNGKYHLEQTITMTITPSSNAHQGDIAYVRFTAFIPEDNVYKLVPENQIDQIASDYGSQLPIDQNDATQVTSDLLSSGFSVIQQLDGSLITSYTNSPTRAGERFKLFATIFSSHDIPILSRTGDNFPEPTGVVAQKMDTLLYITAGVIVVLIITIIAVVYLMRNKISFQIKGKL